jgi:hypothetical protein
MKVINIVRHRAGKARAWHVERTHHPVDITTLDTTLHLMSRRIRPRCAASLEMLAISSWNYKSETCVICSS